MAGWYDGGTANDRFMFAMVLALVAHAGLILGVGFAAPELLPPSASLDVTLAPFRSDTAPEQADFLAPTNQLGGGDADQAAEAASPVASTINASVVSPLLAVPGSPASGAPAPDEAISTRSASERAVSTAEPSPEPAPAPGEGAQAGTTEAESLIARLREQSQAYARRPRVERITSVSARAAEDANYLLSWTERVETVGNRNYPVEARRRRLYGDLRLLVAIKPDGGVAEIRVLQSSGYPVLDQAAVRIVHMAAPYDAFPPGLRARSDLLEVIRTWRFRADRLRTVE